MWSRPAHYESVCTGKPSRGRDTLPDHARNTPVRCFSYRPVSARLRNLIEQLLPVRPASAASPRPGILATRTGTHCVPPGVCLRVFISSEDCFPLFRPTCCLSWMAHSPAYYRLCFPLPFSLRCSQPFPQTGRPPPVVRGARWHKRCERGTFQLSRIWVILSSEVDHWPKAFSGATISSRISPWSNPTQRRTNGCRNLSRTYTNANGS